MSDWTASHNGADWYGECIFGGEGYTDYNYGYSNDEDPDPRELAPEGATIIEFVAIPVTTPNDLREIGELSF